MYELVVAALGAGLLALGHWGRRHPEQLVPSTLAARAHQRKLREYRRGAIACQIVGVVLVVYTSGRMWL